MEQMNLTVGELKGILDKCPDNMPVIIPVIIEEDANVILGFRHVRTVGVLECDWENPENRTALCLNSSEDGLDISSQVNKRGTTCKRVMF